MIRANKISFYANDKLILDSISAEFNVGEVTCVIGVSGCGKSTLIKILSGRLKPTDGTIEYSLIESKKLHPKLTAVFQNYKLLPNLTVEQNLNLIIKCNNLNFINAELEVLLQRFQVSHLKSSRIYNISSGERQRIAIIRAILLNPTYLLLDEITAALDIEASAIVSDFLDEYKKQGKAIVLVTHSINLCKQIGDKVIFIDKGKIIEQGEINILTTPKTDRLKKFISHS